MSTNQHIQINHMVQNSCDCHYTTLQVQYNIVPKFQCPCNTSWLVFCSIAFSLICYFSTCRELLIWRGFVIKQSCLQIPFLCSHSFPPAPKQVQLSIALGWRQGTLFAYEVSGLALMQGFSVESKYVRRFSNVLLSPVPHRWFASPTPSFSCFLALLCRVKTLDMGRMTSPWLKSQTMVTD